MTEMAHAITLCVVGRYSVRELGIHGIQFRIQLPAPLFKRSPGTLPECKICSRLLSAMGDFSVSELAQLGEAVQSASRRELLCWTE